MPVINGRLHLPTQHLTPRQKWAYGVGVGVAVAFVAGSWWVVAGYPTLTALIAGVGSGVSRVSQRAGDIRTEATDVSAPGVDAARTAISDLLKDAQAKQAAAAIVAEQLKPVPSEHPL